MRIDKELDLVSFVKRNRFVLSGVLGLLTAKQRLFVSEFSQINIHESSCLEEGDSVDDGQG